MMKVLPLQHAPECNPVHNPCDVCKVMSHLRTSMSDEAFKVYVDLVQKAAVEVNDPNEVDLDAAPLEYIHLHGKPGQLLEQVVPTMRALLEMSEAELKEKGFSEYAIERIQSDVRRICGKNLRRK